MTEHPITLGLGPDPHERPSATTQPTPSQPEPAQPDPAQPGPLPSASAQVPAALVPVAVVPVAVVAAEPWAPGVPQLVSSWRGTESWGDPSRLHQENAAGQLYAADVHVALTLGRLAGEEDRDILREVAAVVAAARGGSSCTVVQDAELRARLAGSPLVAGPELSATGRPVRLVGDLLYLDRFWRDERLVVQQILARAARHPVVDLAALRECLSRTSAGGDTQVPDRQRVATALAVLNNFTVIAGGPGTGKTTTVARVIAALMGQPGPAPRIALAAPTGKAAARLQASIAGETSRMGLELGELRASTIHRLLGFRPGSPPRHRAENPLPHDVVIVDETSMVSLPLLAKILDAVRPDARLVLLGDPDQLASVDVGAVLADLVGRPASADADPRLPVVVAEDLAADEASLLVDASRAVVRLNRGYRNNPEIAELAQAIQDRDPQHALEVLRDPARSSIQLIEIDEETELTDPHLEGLRRRVVEQMSAVAQAARAGDAAGALDTLGHHQILTAHRHGPFGAARWSTATTRAVARAQPGYADRVGGDPNWYVGRPVIVTRNDEDTGLSNGDAGVAVLRGDRLGVAFDAGTYREFHPGRLPEHLPLQAITVHRAQGSQYTAVTVVLPEPGSALLTRELLYTAVTRAKEQVTILGSSQSVVAAIEHQAQRASGLRRASAWSAPG